MAALAFAALLLLAMAGQSSANWCVCKSGSDAVLQKTLDYACGAGADCNPIKSSGSCYNPNSVKAHCDYAVNSYFQKKGQAQGTCDFAGTATPVTTDPSVTGCTFPSSASTSGSTTPTTGTATPTTGTTTPTTGTTTPTTGTTPTTSGTTPTSTGTTGTTTGATPYTATPGVFGVSPSGAGYTDDSAGIRLINMTSLFSFITLFFSGLMLWWG
ncbi:PLASMODESMATA CALLOSE-BINDING PROTEIN 3-like [Argentina anserina]|uniref:PLASMODESMATA CALLOSE-BINDING PROTEIN 3-like n=1 Tax=Argentina anserina TaxID=57926 RepID=UPI002176787D|nr:PLASMODESMATA CALLOSE-BINDING PROTEIN 3-like [Potentilla anserina]